MTDAPGGYPPPSDRGLGNGGDPGTSYGASTATTYVSDPGAANDSPSRTDTAKDQAGQLGQTAKDSGQQVAGTAKDQARNVAHEGRRQVKDLTRQAGNQVNEQARAQKDKATSGLRGLSNELRSMADKSEQSGPVTDYAHQAADKLGDVAQWLESREPGHLVEEVRDLARRKPGTFLIGAAVAGVVAGRLTRGAAQAAKDDSTGSSRSYAGNGTGYASTTTGTTGTTGMTGTTGTPTSGSFAGETYPADPGTPIGNAAEADVIIVEDASVRSGYGTERDR
jgi:hypothetical protein